MEGLSLAAEHWEPGIMEKVPVVRMVLQIVPAHLPCCPWYVLEAHWWDRQMGGHSKGLVGSRSLLDILSKAALCRYLWGLDLPQTRRVALSVGALVASPH